MEEEKTIETIIKERIQKDFAKLMPDEKFQALVEHEVKWFQEEREVPSYRPGKRYEPSPLVQLVRNELEKMFKSKLKEILDSPDYRGFWDANKESPGKVVKEIIKELSPQLWEMILAEQAQVIISHIRNNISQGF